MFNRITKHKGKIITVVLIVLSLAAAWIFGGGYARNDNPKRDIDNKYSSFDITETLQNAASPIIDPITDEAALEPTSILVFEEVIDDSTATFTEEPRTIKATETPVPTIIETPTSAPTSAPVEISTQVIDPSTGKDKFETDPVPDGNPLPAEPQDTAVSTTVYTCTLSVRCDTILDNISSLNPEKKELVASNGVIFEAADVTFYEGENVFNILQREMKRAKIHMEFRNTPIYNSAYIRGINNLYEFDCGELSGWMYKVNDWFPNYGCSRYQLKNGDIIEWVFTCDLGRDVGGFYATGGDE